jgi:hypothetical protein
MVDAAGGQTTAVTARRGVAGRVYRHHMASKLELWNKAGRFLSAAVVVAFFLPFFGISCQGMDIVRFSGADMVGGCKPGGMIAEAEGEIGKMGGSSYGGEMPGVERKPLAMVAMGAAVLACGLAWAMRGKRQALLATFALALVGTGAMVGLYVTITGELTDMAKKPPGSGAASDDDGLAGGLEREASRELEKIDVDAGARFGFWLTSAGFISILVITGLALRERPGTVAGAAPPSGGYPPPGYPPPGGPPPPA